VVDTVGQKDTTWRGALDDIIITFDNTIKLICYIVLMSELKAGVKYLPIKRNISKQQLAETQFHQQN